MQYITLIIIILCFIIQITYWLITARAVKKVSENRGGWTMRISAIIIILIITFLSNQIASFIPFFNYSFYSENLVLGIIADIITIFGMLTMIYARKALGSNWSANVVLKEDHELIINGPYRFVRHPIYSGLILMILGIALYFGTFSSFFLFILFFIGAYYKAYKEEKMLIEHFGEQYLAYRNSTKALIPIIF